MEQRLCCKNAYFSVRAYRILLSGNYFHIWMDEDYDEETDEETWDSF